MPIPRGWPVWLLLLFAPVVAFGGDDSSSCLDLPVAAVEISFKDGLHGREGECRQIIERTVRAGVPLQAELVRQSLEKLVEAGLAASTTVSVGDCSGGAVTVRYEIQVPLRITGVSFRGVAAAYLDDLRGAISQLESGALLSPAAVDRGADEIVAYYQERGYFDAAVTSLVQRDAAAGRVTVIYDVVPGSQCTVAELRIKGEVGPRNLGATLRLRQGVPYMLEALQADLDDIRRRHLEENYLAPEIGRPELERNPATNSVVVVIPVRSGPKVQVEVQGVELREAKLREILPVYTEGGLDAFQLDEGDRRLAEYMQREGYVFVRVRHRLEQPSPQQARLVYVVEPGRRYRVAAIELVGASAITYEQLRQDLQSRRADVVRRGMASREMLEHDSDVIERRLHGLGYRRARVRERRLAVVPNSDDVVVSFVIYQGPQFVVDWVSLRGNLVFSSSELLPRPGLARGLPYTDQAAATDANAILQHYAGDGYVASQVVPHVEEVDGARVVVTYEINEGRRAYVSSIVVLGNARTDEGTVRDYISFQPGVVLKLAELRRTEQRLFETGAFRHVVVHSEVIGQTADGLGEQRAVYVDLDEAKPWLFIYGGGYVSDDGPRGLVELSNVNLFGRLNTVGLQMRASPRQQIARVSYTDPLPLDRPWPLLVALSFTRELKDAFSLYRATTLAQVQYQYKPTSAFFFRYNFEQVRVFDLKVSESELERNDRPVRLGKLSAGFVADNRNNPFDPTRGTYSSVDFTVAANAFGGSENYVRFFGEHQRYHQFPKAPRLTYAGAIKFGVADAYGSSEDLPISERFFGGGARSLRGFRFEQAGPRDPVTNEPVGGDVLLVINNELRFPLFWKVGGAAFSDTGNVFVNFDDFTLENVTETLGFGVRIDTPVGPVRVDFGYLLNPPDGVPSSAVHLSFGQSF